MTVVAYSAYSVLRYYELSSGGISTVVLAKQWNHTCRYHPGGHGDQHTQTLSRKL